MPTIKLSIDGTDYEMISHEEYTPNYAVPILYMEGVRYLGRKIKKEKDIPKPDWEIQTIQSYKGTLARRTLHHYDLRDEYMFVWDVDKGENVSGGMYYADFLLSEKDNKIHSVKRLSDSETFSVGDFVQTNDANYTFNFSFNIGSFELQSGNMMVITDDVTKSRFDFKMIEKVKPKVPLFTTEDGVEIYKDFDEFIYWVNTKIWFQGHCYVGSYEKDDTCKYFSTEEKAKDWLLHNKPIEVSYKDLFDFCQNDIVPHLPFTIHTVKEFFKSKINL